jgi:hypothetical protein
MAEHACAARGDIESPPIRPAVLERASHPPDGIGTTRGPDADHTCDPTHQQAGRDAT